MATQDVTLPEGPQEQFPHSVEPHLRQLGLPTALKKGMLGGDWGLSTHGTQEGYAGRRWGEGGGKL